MEGNIDEPKDAQVIRSILDSMDVKEYDAEVVDQLLEFYQRQTAEMISKAGEYRNFDNPRREIETSDVLMSVRIISKNSFVPPPPWQITSAIAARLNNVPLPIIPDRLGVLLPPEKHCLIAPNFQLKEK